jgi:hypothetical protein
MSAKHLGPVPDDIARAGRAERVRCARSVLDAALIALVVGGVTPVAVVRHLPFISTINRFVPAKSIDHVHIQVNLDTFKGSF